MKCRVCKENAEGTKKKFSWLWLMIWTLLTGFGGIVYILYHFTKQNNVCPICKSKLY